MFWRGRFLSLPEDESLWVGGEGVDVLTVQAGGRRGVEQDQLFALGPEEHILVVDRERRVALLGVDEWNECHFRPATEEDIGAHIVGRLPTLDTPAALFWGLRVLRHFRLKRIAGPLEEKLSRVAPTVRFNWSR